MASMNWNWISTIALMVGVSGISPTAVATAAAETTLLRVMRQTERGQSKPPDVGDVAADFTLSSLAGPAVRFSEYAAAGPVVLVVLRGWPGYDCPFCTRQFSDYLAGADDLKEAGLRVLFVYPGPAAELREHARAFTAERSLPAHFTLVLDPDYTFTKLYGLRWDAPNETAYPATFVVDSGRRVQFARISRAHGGRTPVSDVLAASKPMR